MPTSVSDIAAANDVPSSSDDTTKVEAIAAVVANQKEKDESTSSDVEVDVFAMVTNKVKRRKKRNSKKRKLVNISIASVLKRSDATNSAEPATVAASVTAPMDEQNDNTTMYHNVFEEDDDEEEEGCGDLSFFSETHEGQDPIMKNRLHVGMEKLEQDKKEDMAKINAYLIAKWEERTETLNKQVAKIRNDVIMKQNNQRTQLAHKHRSQQEMDKEKIDEGRKWLLDRQRGELEQKQQQLRQEAQQTGKSKNVVLEEWEKISAQLQTRHAYQLQQFELKEVSMKERSAKDASTQNQILEAHHKKRSAEAEAFIDDLTKKCQQRQKNLKATLNRLHERRFVKRRGDIQEEFSEPLDSVCHSKRGEEEDDEFHSHQEFTHDHDNSLAHTAVLRHKRRKHIMNGTTVQVAVDIHNEGLFLMARSTGQGNENCLFSFANVSGTSPGVGTLVTNDVSGRPCLFIPWGAKARSFLYSITCGEIPSGYGLEVAAAGSSPSPKLLDGGLVKCMITDTRTSHDNASRDRAQSYPTVQANARSAYINSVTKRVAGNNARIEELESDIEVLSLREKKIDQAHRVAVQRFEQSKAIMDDLKVKVQQFFGKDGTPSPNLNPESKQKILSSMYKYKNDYESARNEELTLRNPLELARLALVSKKEELEKVKQELKVLRTHDKEATSASGVESYLIDKRAENLINAICQVAQRRRAHVNRKKGTSDSNTVSSISEDEKKSFAQKMVRRRIVTMLRPSQSSIVKEVKDNISGSSSSDKQKAVDVGMGDCDSRIDPKLRAEELLLLSLYPEVEEALSFAPNEANLNWAEPGWQINLSPPKERNPHSILPTDLEGQLPRYYLSVCCSSGRQTASLISRRHLRTLEGPLSFVSEASAPAELNPGQNRVTEDTGTSDPLSISDDDMRLGYSFVLRSPEKTVSDADKTEQKPSAKRKSKKLDDDTLTKVAKAKRLSQKEYQRVSPKQTIAQPIQAMTPLETATIPIQQNQQMQPNQQMQHNQQLRNPQQMQPNQQIPPNQQMILPNVMNRNQLFMNNSINPEQYRWVLQQQLQQQQQQQQMQQHFQQQQMQIQQHQQQQQQRRRSSVNEGNQNNSSSSAQNNS